MKRQQIAHLSHVCDRDTFIPEFDPTECYSLKDFLNEFPTADYRSGVWNKYELVSMQEAIARSMISPYGADIFIEWDEAWEQGLCDGTMNIQFSCPTESDMW